MCAHKTPLRVNFFFSLRFELGFIAFLVRFGLSFDAAIRGYQTSSRSLFCQFRLVTVGAHTDSLLQ